ncbi:MAG TPA: ABC transporter ATP-binding protein [Syntrophothermus lipocalidus]|nr:ABC transporter ATP-binding protein [Syntrophothermus lipocalidus]HOV42631.1 ABC transporter ATP-binding protein [Syntrophothermus lipocalidus]
MDKKPLFKLREVSFGYRQGEPVFSNLSLEIMPGESVCILGANGAGKSTLLKMLAGLVFPFAGGLEAFEEQLTEKRMENDRFAQEYHRRVGFVFQNPDAQLFTTRVWDEIAFGPLQLGLSPEEITTRVEDVIKMLSISNLKDRSPYHLSQGEKKKVAIASVLVMNPQVLILDEPTTGLDPKTQRWLVELLLELNQNGRTIITSTHDLNLVHLLADRVLLLSEDHRLVYDGPSQKVLANRRLLASVNLIDEYSHTHDQGQHTHLYVHG